jgi:hypothetical protein
MPRQDFRLSVRYNPEELGETSTRFKIQCRWLGARHADRNKLVSFDASVALTERTTASGPMPADCKRCLTELLPNPAVIGAVVVRANVGEQNLSEH